MGKFNVGDLVEYVDFADEPTGLLGLVVAKGTPPKYTGLADVSRVANRMGSPRYKVEWCFPSGQRHAVPAGSVFVEQRLRVPQPREAK